MAQLQPQQTTHMAIASQDLEYIKSQVFIWIKEAGITPNNNQLTERIIRVEEGLKSQMQLMQQGFEQMDRQFELQREEMNRRFEQQREEMNQRFEQVDKRFEQVDKRFEQVDKRFEQVDKRFEQVDKRFEQVDKRFDKMFVNFRWAIMAMFAFWSISMGIVQFTISNLAIN